MSQKYLIGALVVLAALVFLYVFGCGILSQELRLNETQARQLALDELRFTHPNATVSIEDVQNVTDSWKIRAKVVEQPGTVCPTLLLVELQYPRFGFVPRERYITRNCEVLGCKDAPGCLIAYEEEAVLIAQDSTRNSISVLQQYLADRGRDNVQAAAEYRSSFFSQPANQTYNEVWVVTWSSNTSSARLVTVLNRTGGAAVESYALNQ